MSNRVRLERNLHRIENDSRKKNLESVCVYDYVYVSVYEFDYEYEFEFEREKITRLFLLRKHTDSDTQC